MNGFVGADVDQLIALARRVELQSQKFSEIAASSSVALMVAEWTGADIDRIRNEWSRQSKPSMQRMAGNLAALAIELRKQAEQQRSTSTAGGRRPLSAADQRIYDAALKDPNSLSSLSREDVAAFWAALSPEQQKALMERDSVLVGNLSGVPFEDRIESNRLTAKQRLKDPFLSQKERAYLQAVVDPPAGKERIQLVVYDPDDDRIVEMVGHFTDKTTTVVTYVPGTFTTMDSFYSSDGPQQISRYLNQKDPNTVAFVYKDGAFPQDLISASDKSHAEENSHQLASFQGDVDAERPSSSNSVAIGHSWGFADVAYSEQQGAHYDKVVSLSGAYLPPDWHPASGTEYSNFSYRVDALSGAQTVGGGGPGYPNWNPEFQQHHYISPVEVAVEAIAAVGSANPIASLSARVWLGIEGLSNHGLIASSAAENQAALEDLRHAIHAD